MKKMKFSKMVASGNDFVVIDIINYSLQFTVYSLPELAVKLCDRKFGVGGDGLLVIEKSRKADFRMRIFNPDGSEPSMCGNGARCAALYAFRNRIAPGEMAFETLAGDIGAIVKGSGGPAGKAGIGEGGRIRVKMSVPSRIKSDISIVVNGKSLPVHFINTGVPHAVCFVQNLDEVDVVGLGRAIRYHKKFAPAGTNVDFVKVADKDRIKVRTYERGVEDETLACGTGSVASAIMSALVRGASQPVKVETRSGEILVIYFDRKGDKFQEVYLEGDAAFVFKGEVKL